MDAPPPLTYAALDALLYRYKQLFSIRTTVLPSNAFSFREQFQQLSVGYMATSVLDLTPLREAMELYGLLLFLHRETTSDVLLADSRLRLAVCARDEVRPRINLEIVSAQYNQQGQIIRVADTRERAKVLWKAFIQLFEYDTPQPPLSDHYYETRRTMLELFGVDEAFVADVGVHVALGWKWSEEMADLMETFPAKELRRLELVSAATAMTAQNGRRTRLLFTKVNASMSIKMTDYGEVAQHVRSWVLMPGGIRSLSVQVYSDWTDADAATFVAILNQGHVDTMKLKISTARALRLAFDICAQVQTVSDMTLKIKVTDDWGPDDLLSDGYSTLKTSSSRLRTLQIYITEVPSMSMFVRTMTHFIECDYSPAKTVMLQSGELQLRTCVNEPQLDDLSQLTRLLTEVGSQVKVLHINSYASSEYYNEGTYAKAPEAFQLAPIILACPKLRLLSIQGAFFNDLPQLYEKGFTELQTLQVQYAPVASVLAVAMALGQKESQCAKKLVEFATRVAADDVFEAFIQALDNNSKLEYLRLGRRALGDDFAARLSLHHQKKLAPGGSDFAKILDAMVAVGNPRATFARECMDDDALESVAEFVGSALHRQIQFR